MQAIRGAATLVAVVILSLTSCIVGDQLVTLTIQPDGSATWLRLQSNIRSTEEGEKGAQELKRYVEDFEAGRDPDCARIREVGGEIVEARWARSQEPYASVVSARLSRAALEAFYSHKNEKGEPVVETRFTQEGKRRRLSMRVTLDEATVANLQRTPGERRQDRGNGVSETRIGVARGRITAARGFIVADDHRSALVDIAEIHDLLQAGGNQTELYLEWEVAGD